MSADRDRMIATLKQHVVPVLRERGFAGTFPHFRRRHEAGIDLLTFQFDKWGGGFVVELAGCPADGVARADGTPIAPNAVTAHDVPRRLRLGARDADSDHWFRYDGLARLAFGDRFERAARAVLARLDDQAEAYWRSVRG